MKKQPFRILILLLVLPILLSWGVTGHRTIGRIAENHLTTQSKTWIQDLLGDQSLADVSTWADEVRSTPVYQQTAPWHFLNLSIGLDYATFEQQVKSMTVENVYSALLQCEHGLSDNKTPRDKKIEDLKFIVHFVGDMHQPMHISRAEDKGGNTIQVNYDGKGTNLHALWDTRLLEHAGLTYDQLAEKYDHVSPEQIRKWQSDPIMIWIWESYEISSKLYQELDAMPSRSINDSYYQAHIGIIEDRIEKAGIRLAGTLNSIFAAMPLSDTALIPPAAGNAGPEMSNATSTSYCDSVYSSKVLENSQMTLLNLGGNYPNQKLTVVIKAKDRGKFAVSPDVAFSGENICVTGVVTQYNGKPEIVVTDPGQIQVNSP